MANSNGGPIISAQGLSKKFDEQYAVRNLNLEIFRGEIVGFVGPSGCGKTTTVRLLNGYYTPTEGAAQIFGRSPSTLKEMDRRKIGYMPQLFALYQDLTVWENLNFSASLYGIGFIRGKRLNKILDFVDLRADRKKLTSQISGGMQRRLSLAAAMVHDPELLFLDEPTAGIDPVLRKKFWDYFEVLRDQGRTLFVTTQYVSEAAYCDRIGVMVAGELVCVETPEGLRKRAYGGDVVNIQTDETQSINLSYIREISQLPYVKERPRLVDENTVQIVVEDGSTAIPELVEFMKVRNIQVKSIEPYSPPFDDVFFRIVKTEQEETA